MNGFLLLIPFFLIRFGLLSFLNKQALPRAAHFAPMRGREKAAYFVYQLTTAAIVLYPLFLSIEADFTMLFYAGVLCYVLGLCLCAASVTSFCFPDEKGLNTRGLYRFSRNPMYVAYFICFIGVAMLTRSLLLFSFVLIFQLSAHWIILAEERWCLETFDHRYQQYMKAVRRYL